MFTITLPSRPLLALREIAPKKDVRHYMCGVSLEVGPEGAFLSASNGYILCVTRLPEGPANVQATVVIPRSLLERVKPSRLSHEPLDVALTARRESDSDAARWRLELDTLDGCISDWATAEWAPNWRALIPRQVSDVTAQFSLDALDTVRRAHSALQRGKGRRPVVAIGHNGHNTALLDFNSPDFIGAIQPMRADAPRSAPAWIDSRPAYAPAVIAAA